jgi:uncharacterized protein (DUF2236 family)
MFVGGIRALLEQALHPEAMAGVAAHSNFREDAWGRLQRTGDYVGTLTFGTIDEAEKLAARVRKVHAMLKLDGGCISRYCNALWNVYYRAGTRYIYR